LSMRCWRRPNWPLACSVAHHFPWFARRCDGSSTAALPTLQPQRERSDAAEGEGGRGNDDEQRTHVGTPESDRGPAADRSEEQSRRAREKRPRDAARALAGEVKQHAETEYAVAGRNDVKIERSGLEYSGVRTEQRQPGVRERRSSDA